MEITLGILTSLVGGAFFAGLVDSMAGGGGLISLPLLFACGVPPHLALGTNKVQSFSGTMFSTWRYLKSGHMYLPMAGISAVGSLLGSYLGAQVVLRVPPEKLTVIILPLIVLVSIITFARRDFGQSSRFSPHSKLPNSLKAAAIGTAIGFYDGFFGPGTGTFLAFSFVLFMGFNFVQGTANAKLSNLASNFAAIIAFAFTGNIMWTLALPMAAANICGNLVGSGLAIKRGAVIIKPVFALVLAGIFTRLVITYF